MLGNLFFGETAAQETASFIEWCVDFSFNFFTLLWADIT